MLRALADPRADVLAAYLRRIDDAMESAASSGDAELVAIAGDLRPVRAAVADRARAAAAAATAGAEERATAQAGARQLLLQMAALLAAALLEQATYDSERGNGRSALVTSLWVRRRLVGDPATGAGHRWFAQLVDGAPA